MFTDQRRRFAKGFKDAYGEGRVDHQKAFFEGRENAKKDEDAPRIQSVFGTNATIQRMLDMLGISTPYAKARADRGMGVKQDPIERVGQGLGTIAADFTQDHSREAWWLLNAPQAIGNVAQELALNKVAPAFYRAKAVRTDGGHVIPVSPGTNELAAALDLIDLESGRKKKGVGAVRDPDSGKLIYTKREFAPGHVASLAIPTGVAINAGIGLLNPVGGSGGYEAVIPSAEDPTKTDNLLMEVGSKYFLGRTGGLLPYDEFKEKRPDVSKGEYKGYKAFKYDKSLDWDPSDGDVNLLPGGILKATDDGIHGPEVQFLGRSLPLTTTAIPFAGALAGTTGAAWASVNNRMGLRKKNAIMNSLAGGLAGLAASGGGGYAIELERRKRNAESTEASQQAQFDRI